MSGMGFEALLASGVVLEGAGSTMRTGWWTVTGGLLLFPPQAIPAPNSMLASSRDWERVVQDVQGILF